MGNSQRNVGRFIKITVVILGTYLLLRNLGGVDLVAAFMEGFNGK